MIGGGLPSGEAALALPCWQAPSNSSLDWDHCWGNIGSRPQRSVYGSWALSVGDSTRTRLVTSASARGRVQGEGLTLRMMGSWDSGIRRSRTTQDESRGKAYIEDDGKLGLRCIDLGRVKI